MRAASSGVLMSPLPMTGMLYGLLDAGDELPVGGAAVALGAGARVDGDGFDACCLGQLGDVDGDDGVFVPAGAELDGERDFYSGADRLEDFAEQREVAEEAGAAALHDFFGGAAEVDVDGVVAEVLDHSGGVGHDLRVGAEELRGDGVLVFLEIKVAESFVGAAGDAFGAGELGHQQAAVAEAADDTAEERVGDAGHGGEDRAGADGEVAELVGLRDHGEGSV